MFCNRASINDVPQPSREQKREAALRAAEARQKDWRQGGAVDPAQSERLRNRQEKEVLLGKIEAYYKSKGDDAPIGLGACDLASLRKHWNQLNN